MPKLIIMGSIVLMTGLSLWMVEEAVLLAPSLFSKSELPISGHSKLHQGINSAIAITGFPLAGLAIRPSDKSAVRALLRTWTGLCLMIGTVFTATTIIMLTCSLMRKLGGGHLQSSSALPLQSRIPLHATNAVIGFYFAHRFYRGLQLPAVQALQSAWTAGRTAGALIAFTWPITCIESLPGSLGAIEPSWELLLFVLPSVALLCYVVLTSSPLRTRLLRWMWSGRESLVAAVGMSADDTGKRRSDVGTVSSLWCGLALLAPPLWAGCLALMSTRELAALVTREVEVREAIQLAHLTLGVVHAIVTRGHRTKVWMGAWAAGITLCGDGAAFGLRLGDASLVWVPVRSACLPFLVGWFIAELSAHVRAQQMDNLRAELGAASASLLDEKRHNAELEEARRSALMCSVLAQRRGEASGCRTPADDASDGTDDVDLQSSGSSEDLLLPPASRPCDHVHAHGHVTCTFR